MIMRNMANPINPDIPNKFVKPLSGEPAVKLLNVNDPNKLVLTNPKPSKGLKLMTLFKVLKNSSDLVAKFSVLLNPTSPISLNLDINVK
jgi:hypothetical protein